MDLDDQQYLDMCIMGIGTNILGYSHHKVDQEVIRAALTEICLRLIVQKKSN